MKRKIVSVLLCVLLLASLLPVSAFADTAVTEQTADIVSTNNSQEVWIYINNVTWPKLGQKLDQDISITDSSDDGLSSDDALITEGDKAPTYEWYAFNDCTGGYEPVTDPDYVCAARAYKLRVVTHFTEEYQSSEITYRLNGEEVMGMPVEGKTDDGGNYIELPFRLSYDKAHTISTVSFTNMPYTYRVGDKVANFKPATLKGAGKTGEYFWYLAKLDRTGNIDEVYIAKNQEATALKIMPDLTSGEIAAARKNFGTTFEKGCKYELYNFQIIPVKYQYDFQVTINVTYRNGMTVRGMFDGQPIGEDGYTEPMSTCFVHVALTAAPVIKVSTTSAGKPQISWSKVDGAAKYKVFYSTDGKKYDLLATTTGTKLVNTSAKIGTTYYYKVSAVDDNGVMTAYSNVERIKCRPAAPTVTISRSGGKAKLSWKKVSDATKYYVYRSTDGVKYKPYYTVSKTSFTDSKSKSGTKYYYKVMAVAVVNETNVGSACSAVKSIMTTLAKPTVKITTSNGKPKLSWSKVTGADKYYVYRSTNGKDYTLLIKTTKMSVTNTGAKKGVKYYYKVKAICSANTKANSAFSAVVSIKATK